MREIIWKYLDLLRIELKGVTDRCCIFHTFLIVVLVQIKNTENSHTKMHDKRLFGCVGVLNSLNLRSIQVFSLDSLNFRLFPIFRLHSLHVYRSTQWFRMFDGSRQNSIISSYIQPGIVLFFDPHRSFHTAGSTNYPRSLSSPSIRKKKKLK